MSLEDRKPPVSIVVVHYRGLEILRRCLSSIFNTDYSRYEVILVDNGSDDGSVDAVEGLFRGRIRIIRSGANLGFVGGNNLALKEVSSKYVVLLNNDTAVHPKWLKKLVEAAECDEYVGAAMPKLLSMRDPTRFEYNGACGGMLDVYGVPFCRGRVFDVIEEDRGQYDTTVEVFWASGAALFARTEAVKRAGLLDPLLYAHMEEIDLCWRMRLLGYKVICVPDSVVYHLGGGTDIKDKFYLKQRNNIIVLIKNYSSRNLLRYLPRRVILDMLSILYFLARGDCSRALYTIKAYLWILKKLKEVYKARVRTQRLRRVKDSEILKAMCKGNISVQYYLLKRRSFRQIYGLPQTLDYYCSPRIRILRR